MTKKYHDTEYLYLSACIHSWETRLLTPERREQLLSAPTDRDAARVLEEMGWPAFDPEAEAAPSTSRPPPASAEAAPPVRMWPSSRPMWLPM